MKIITISREFGSGGRELGHLRPRCCGGPESGPDSIAPAVKNHIGNAEQPGGGVSASGRVFRPIQAAGWAASAVSSYRARYPPSMGITMPLT